MTITAHTLVKNEARFVWYSVMSVLNHVDKILLWDTGSTDGTVNILKEIKKVGGGKVDLREVGNVTAETFTKVRQDMLDATNTNWFIVVDGDEIWWEGTIQHLLLEINDKGKVIESIVVPTINLVGDIYHYQEVAAGQYNLAGRTGHLNLRAINKNIPGLHSYGPHGQWGWVDGENRMIQDRGQKKVVYIDAPYLHATHLVRSADISHEQNVPKRQIKRKYELGIPFPLDFFYPEVFFRPRPDIVQNVWENMDNTFRTHAMLQTPLRKIKRRVFPGKVGY